MVKSTKLIIARGKVIDDLFTVDTRQQVRAAVNKECPEYLFSLGIGKADTEYLYFRDIPLLKVLGESAGGKLRNTRKFGDSLEGHMEELKHFTRTIPKGVKIRVIDTQYREEIRAVIAQTRSYGLDKKLEEQPPAEPPKPPVVQIKVKDVSPLDCEIYSELRNLLAFNLTKHGAIQDRSISQSELRNNYRITNEHMQRYNQQIGSPDFYSNNFGYSAKKVLNVLDRIIADSSQKAL